MCNASLTKLLLLAIGETVDDFEYFFFSFETHSHLTSFILAWRVPWPGWPLAFQVFPFSRVTSMLLSMYFCVTENTY